MLLAPELSPDSSTVFGCVAKDSSLALSVLLRKRSLLALLEDAEDNTGPSMLVLLEARWRGGGGGGGGIIELRLLGKSMLCTDGGRPEIRVDGIRAGGGAGAEPDLDLGVCGS
jgi:hypothetical protein